MNEPSASSCGNGCRSGAETAARQPGEGVDGAWAWFRSTFHIPGMDCPADEQMIRLRLGDVPTRFMAFDLTARTLVVGHAGDVRHLLERLLPLGYGAELRESRPLDGDTDNPVPDPVSEAKILRWLLGINALMFLVELFAGRWADSAGLIADAVDMFADAAVYGVALWAVGKAAGLKLSAARLSGLLQLALAVGALSETGRRILAGSSPQETTMISIALLALAANVWCLLLIARHRQRGVHMRASFIFSANDVLANLGVILAGALVAWTGSPLPDWIIGLVIGAMVLAGAIRILRLR